VCELFEATPPSTWALVGSAQVVDGKLIVKGGVAETEPSYAYWKLPTPAKKFRLSYDVTFASFSTKSGPVGDQYAPWMQININPKTAYRLTLKPWEDILGFYASSLMIVEGTPGFSGMVVGVQSIGLDTSKPHTIRMDYTKTVPELFIDGVKDQGYFSMMNENGLSGLVLHLGFFESTELVNDITLAFDNVLFEVD